MISIFNPKLNVVFFFITCSTPIVLNILTKVTRLSISSYVPFLCMGLYCASNIIRDDIPQPPSEFQWMYLVISSQYHRRYQLLKPCLELIFQINVPIRSLTEKTLQLMGGYGKSVDWGRFIYLHGTFWHVWLLLINWKPSCKWLINLAFTYGKDTYDTGDNDSSTLELYKL